MEILRRPGARAQLSYEEMRHLIKGDHADCRLDTRALRNLWQAHRDDVLAEFDRGTVEGRGELRALGGRRLRRRPGRGPSACLPLPPPRSQARRRGARREGELMTDAYAELAALRKRLAELEQMAAERKEQPMSLADERQARREREAAGRFEENEELERALAWQRDGDARWDRLPAGVKLAAGYYASEREAARKNRRPW